MKLYNFLNNLFQWRVATQEKEIDCTVLFYIIWTIWHILHLILSEWVTDCCLIPKEQFFSYMNIIVRTSYIQWNDDVCFVLDQYTELDFYSAGSLKQQSASRQNILLHSVTNTNFIASGDRTWTGPTTYRTQG